MENLGKHLLRTTREAAEYLRISRHTLAHWIRRGRLDAVKIGRRVMVAQAELDRYIDSHPARGQGAK